MKTYEALYIVSPEVEEDGIQTVVSEVEGLVTTSGGSIVRSEIWGKRKLAYEVNKHTEGNYVLLRFTAAPDFNQRLENYFKLSETVIRYLVLNFDEKTLRLEAEQAKRREEEIRNSAVRSQHGDEDDDHERTPREERIPVTATEDTNEEE